MKNNYRTDFLFPKSSYLIGAGSIIALMGNYYTFNADKSADLKALRSDWGVVGDDFRNAMKSFETSNKKLLMK